MKVGKDGMLMQEELAHLKKEREYKEESTQQPGTYMMTCDKVDAKVKVNEDGSWEILDILGRHEQAYEKKKVYE